MATIVTRAGKGSPLTNNEVDANFVNLNTELVAKVASITSADGSVTVTGTTAIDLSVVSATTASNLLVPVRNTTGSTLTKGTVVYISGATGQISTVSKAIASSDTTSAQTLGLIAADLANNTNGNAMLIGSLLDVNTAAYSDGAQLYLSPTVAGTMTTTKPYAPQHLVYIGVVEYAHPVHGKIFVKIQNGYELDELHNVAAQTPTNGQTIVYNSTTDLWEKNTVSLTAGVNGTLPVANGGTGGTSASTARASLGAAASGANSDITSIALTTGTITTAPTAGTDIVNKAYADGISAGINFHQAVRLATAATLPAYTYANGSSGVGATITGNAVGALSIDGVAVAANDRVLIKNETSGAAPYNGVYVVTRAGNGSTTYLLTRASDYNTSGTGINQIDAGDFFLVTAGNTQANTSWVQQTALPITVGTTGIVFTQFGAPITYSAGTGLTLGGTVFSITNTGVTANSYGSASSVPVIAVNAQGQITSASSSSIAIAASQITSGTIPIANGGTGATTAAGALSSLGAYAATNPAGYTTNVGTVTSVSGTGTVSGLTLSGSVTSSGSLTLGGTLSLTSGNVTTALGYTPANKAGDTFTGYVTIGYGGSAYAGMAIKNTYASASNFATDFLDFVNEGGYQKSSIFGNLGTDGSGYLQFLSTAPGVSRTADTRTTTAYAYYNQWQFLTASGVAAPIFYDSNDTGYYLDAASTSRINQINYTTLYNASDTNYGIVGASGFFDTVNSGVDADALELCYVRGSEVRIGTGGGNKAIKASLFYKGTNTAYYVDPAGTSRLGGITFDGGTTIATSGDITSRRNGGSTGVYYFVSSSTNQYLFWDGSRYLFGNSGPVETDVSLRAPIFYDITNTGYYVDPNSTGASVNIAGSVLMTTSGGERQVKWIFTGRDAYLYGRDSDDVVGLYDTVGGSRFTTDVNNNFVAYGSSRAPIFYDSDNTNYYINPNGGSAVVGAIVIGPNSSSQYTRIGGDGGATDMCTLSASNGNLHIDAKAGNNLYLSWYNNATTQVGGGIAATVYYDRDNTGYYLDATTTGVSLNVAGLIVGGSSASTNVNTANDTGSMSIRGSSTTVASVSFHRTGAYAINMGLGTDNVFRIGGWSASSDCFQMDGSGNLTMLSSSRAPIFYDSNDTGYYCNPNATSRLSSIALGGSAGTYQGVFWANGDLWVDGNGRKLAFTTDGSTDNGGNVSIFAVGNDFRVNNWSGSALNDNFYVFGASRDAACAGNITAYYSDERLKTKTGGIDNALAKVASLEGFTYIENETARAVGYANDRQQVGVSAQAVQAVLPEAVHLAPFDYEVAEDGTITSKSGENYLTVDYSRIVPLLIEAIKELENKVKALEAKE